MLSPARSRDLQTVAVALVIVTITDAGLEVIRETRRLRTRWFSQQLATLAPDERTALEAVIPVLRRIAEE